MWILVEYVLCTLHGFHNRVLIEPFQSAKSHPKYLSVLLKHLQILEVKLQI